MDIVSRLRKFMEYRQIPITQFADSCNIPRPTLSQLLNGRNKKVSDEFISKIHEAYPDLSVMWLMFGEGSMLTDANIEISEPQNSPKIDFFPSEPPVVKPVAADGLFSNLLTENESDNSDGALGAAPSMAGLAKATEITFLDEPSSPRIPVDARDDAKAPAPTAKPAEQQRTPTSVKATTGTASADAKRCVTHIIVYYSDNTFETFFPQGKQ